jgi:anti-sigma regulatory factor (Ser/Thr protein kinase)
VVSFELPGVPSSATKARHFACDQVAHFSAELSDTVAILVTELVTNAILHARTDLRVGIEIRPPVVRLSVTDQSTRLPVLRHYAPDDVTGRGLALIDALADSWGVDLTEEGKSVWCEILMSDAKTLDQRA